jgi:hypothetical protein
MMPAMFRLVVGHHHVRIEGGKHTNYFHSVIPLNEVQLIAG